MNLSEFKNDLHLHILEIGGKIYDERINRATEEIINPSKTKFARSKRYENNQRIQFRLQLLANQYDCEIERLKLQYTELYYNRNKKMKNLLSIGMAVMVIFMIQKLDYNLQLECKALIDELHEKLKKEFLAELTEVLENRVPRLTLNIETSIDSIFEEDWQLVQSIWMYCKNNIDVHTNMNFCEDITKKIHILCAENANAKLKMWEMRKRYDENKKKIKEDIKQAKNWRPTLKTCPNHEIWRKHYNSLLKKVQKYHNFFYNVHNKYTSCHELEKPADETESIVRIPIPTTQEDEVLSTIYAAFDGAAKYCCNENEKASISVVGADKLIPITQIYADQVAKCRKIKVHDIGKMPPPDKIKIDWDLCDTYDDEISTDFVFENRTKEDREKDTAPNLLYDLITMIDPTKLSSCIFSELEPRIENGLSSETELKSKITNVIAREIRSRLNHDEVLNRLNGVLGPAYEAVRMKRVSALSYSRDSVTILKIRTNLEDEEQTQNGCSNTDMVDTQENEKPVKLNHQEYLDSFKKLPPYLFPKRRQEKFTDVYNATELNLSNLSVNSHDGGPHFLFCSKFGDPNLRFSKAQRPSILKRNLRDRFEPIYKQTLRTIINKLENDQYNFLN